jgi:hypothetical protein
MFIVPAVFENSLSHDRELRSAVDRASVLIGTWFEHSHVPFFEDYTDHGIPHINDVLKSTADLLLPTSAEQSFTPADAAIFVLAVLLHDSAMHLTEDGFAALISAANTRLLSTDAPYWSDLWRDFLFDATRWDDILNEAVFGSTDIRVDPGHTYRPHNLTSIDRNLVGEFIRQNHCRLAHEFAVFGVPGAAPDAFVNVLDCLSDDLRFLVGLTARSHGMPLNVAIDQLRVRFHVREYKRIHVPYLMALLRVADYLQIHASRAPKLMASYKNIASPLSRREWDAHDSVVNITTANEDPESLFIQVVPSSLSVTLRLKAWLSGIQEELDASWALLGQLYGRYPGLDQLNIKLRRVSSNLDDTSSLAELVPFIPREIRYRLARSEILTLLVRPLYGERPEAGIRELVQNAVDAVYYRRAIAAEAISNAPEPVMSADVEVRLSRNLIEVRDSGIGMTLDVIEQYFLSVGASFRNSNAWQQVLRKGQSPPRNGRFGIGVLAGYLVGPTIEVMTRHLLSQDGYRFSTMLADVPQDIQKDSSLPVGTTIRVAIGQQVYDRLKRDLSLWDWYCYSDPSVALFVDGIRQQQRILLKESDLSEVPQTHFERVAIDARGVYRPQLIVNGFRIRAINEENDPIRITAKDDRWELSVPLICITDNRGRLPLNLQKTALVDGGLGVETAVARWMGLAFLDQIVRCAPEDSFDLDTSLSAFAYFRASRDIKRSPSFGRLPVVAAREGWAVSDELMFDAFQPESMLSIPELAIGDTFELRVSHSHDCLAFDDTVQRLTSAPEGQVGRTYLGRRVLGVRTWRMLGQADDFLRSSRSGQAGAGLWEQKVIGTPAPTRLDIGTLSLQIKQRRTKYRKIILYEVFFAERLGRSGETSFIGDLWREVLGCIAVPYSREHRLECERKVANVLAAERAGAAAQ